MTVNNITTHPIHLGLGASAEVEPEFTGSMGWYAAYAQRHANDGAEGRLVSLHTFTKSWDMWEMHPQGSEVVLCVTGAIKLHQQNADAAVTKITLGPGEYAINLPGTWHTADVEKEASVVFITAGKDTQHRPR